MKKLFSTLLVSMITATMAFAQIVSELDGPSFIIKNKTSGASLPVPAKDFSTALHPEGGNVNLSGNICNKDNIEITYSSPIGFTPQLDWSYGWNSDCTEPHGSGLTTTIPVKDVPFTYSTFYVKCKQLSNGPSGGVIATYLFCFPGVSQKTRITAKNINASEVQVNYENYAEVASAGQCATVALYDIYGNPVSTGYLDGLGMSTLSTNGKSGIYIVKVIMNNQVVFNQRIQVK